jgi:hypothetical protein
MMHCNDINNGMANQSSKGMKKGLDFNGEFILHFFELSRIIISPHSVS